MHLEGRDPARLARKANIASARMAGVEEHTRKRREGGWANRKKEKERDMYTHREATGQCWKVALLIRAKERERKKGNKREREEDRGIG